MMWYADDVQRNSKLVFQSIFITTNAKYEGEKILKFNCEVDLWYLKQDKSGSTHNIG